MQRGHIRQEMSDSASAPQKDSANVPKKDFVSEFSRRIAEEMKNYVVEYEDTCSRAQREFAANLIENFKHRVLERPIPDGGTYVRFPSYKSYENGKCENVVNFSLISRMVSEDPDFRRAGLEVEVDNQNFSFNRFIVYRGRKLGLYERFSSLFTNSPPSI
jgi:hypothetical protein